MTRKKSNTSHQLNFRTYNSLIFRRNRSFKSKADALSEAKELKKYGYKVRIFKSPNEAFHFTTYIKKSKSKKDELTEWAMNRVKRTR